MHAEQISIPGVWPGKARAADKVIAHDAAHIMAKAAVNLTNIAFFI
jgi:hypothetical protein